jgi:glycolate oxidase FAD binding subunit
MSDGSDRSDLSDPSDGVLAPATLDELVEVVRSTGFLIPVSAGTKARLSRVTDAVRVSTLKLTGITEYEPSEFTFTALAGTPLREMVAALAERGQYLPFDPMMVDAGATLGGTVASGLSGPGRFRYGGLRDFILGVRFVDGLGRLLRMGGKVVKNAAGFDLPKFFVGSLGRFGVLAEITFKVFPRPSSSLTLRLAAETAEEMVTVLTETAASRFEFEAVDVAPSSNDVLVRLAGPEAALELLGREVMTRWPGEMIERVEAERRWGELREFRWVEESRLLVKVPVTPAALAAFVCEFSGTTRYHLSVGGNVAYVSIEADQAGRFQEQLWAHELSGLVLRSGEVQSDGKPSHSKAFGSSGDGQVWLGRRKCPAIAAAVKRALDPTNRFPDLDD